MEFVFACGREFECHGLELVTGWLFLDLSLFAFFGRVFKFFFLAVFDYFRMLVGRSLLLGEQEVTDLDKLI